MNVSELLLSTKTLNKLESEGVETVEELKRLDEDGLLKDKLDARSYKEVIKELELL